MCPIFSMVARIGWDARNAPLARSSPTSKADFETEQGDEPKRSVAVAYELAAFK
jgi:hypothetical protein